MNPFILRFSDGTTFFVGLVTVLLAVVMRRCFRSRFIRPILNVAAIVGIILVILSATPIPAWAYAAWVTTAIAGIALVDRPEPPRRLTLICVVFLVASTVALCVAELPWRRIPLLRVPAGTTVYVLGDSISAGMFTEHRCWPAVLDEITPLQVVNLAQPGATVVCALSQAGGISERQSLVIVEIGGNDLLGETPAHEFQPVSTSSCPRCG